MLGESLSLGALAEVFFSRSAMTFLRPGDFERHMLKARVWILRARACDELVGGCWGGGGAETSVTSLQAST